MKRQHSLFIYISLLSLTTWSLARRTQDSVWGTRWTQDSVWGNQVDPAFGLGDQVDPAFGRGRGVEDRRFGQGEPGVDPGIRSRDAVSREDQTSSLFVTKTNQLSSELIHLKWEEAKRGVTGKETQPDAKNIRTGSSSSQNPSCVGRKCRRSKHASRGTCCRRFDCGTKALETWIHERRNSFLLCFS